MLMLVHRSSGNGEPDCSDADPDVHLGQRHVQVQLGAAGLLQRGRDLAEVPPERSRIPVSDCSTSNIC